MTIEKSLQITLCLLLVLLLTGANCVDHLLCDGWTNGDCTNDIFNQFIQGPNITSGDTIFVKSNLFLNDGPSSLCSNSCYLYVNVSLTIIGSVLGNQDNRAEISFGLAPLDDIGEDLMLVEDSDDVTVDNFQWSRGSNGPYGVTEYFLRFTWSGAGDNSTIKNNIFRGGVDSVVYVNFNTGAELSNVLLEDNVFDENPGPSPVFWYILAQADSGSDGVVNFTATRNIFGSIIDNPGSEHIFFDADKDLSESVNVTHNFWNGLGFYKHNIPKLSTSCGPWAIADVLPVYVDQDLNQLGGLWTTDSSDNIVWPSDLNEAFHLAEGRTVWQNYSFHALEISTAQAPSVLRSTSKENIIYRTSDCISTAAPTMVSRGNSLDIEGIITKCQVNCGIHYLYLKDDFDGDTVDLFRTDFSVVTDLEAEMAGIASGCDENNGGTNSYVSVDDVLGSGAASDSSVNDTLTDYFNGADSWSTPDDFYGGVRRCRMYGGFHGVWTNVNGTDVPDFLENQFSEIDFAITAAGHNSVYHSNTVSEPCVGIVDIDSDSQQFFLNKVVGDGSSGTGVWISGGSSPPVDSFYNFNVWKNLDDEGKSNDAEPMDGSSGAEAVNDICIDSGSCSNSISLASIISTEATTVTDTTLTATSANGREWSFRLYSTQGNPGSNFDLIVINDLVVATQVLDGYPLNLPVLSEDLVHPSFFLIERDIPFDFGDEEMRVVVEMQTQGLSQPCGTKYVNYDSRLNSLSSPSDYEQLLGELDSLPADLTTLPVDVQYFVPRNSDPQFGTEQQGDLVLHTSLDRCFWLVLVRSGEITVTGDSDISDQFANFITLDQAVSASCPNEVINMQSTSSHTLQQSIVFLEGRHDGVTIIPEPPILARSRLTRWFYEKDQLLIKNHPFGRRQSDKVKSDSDRKYSEVPVYKEPQNKEDHEKMVELSQWMAEKIIIEDQISDYIKDKEQVGDKIVSTPEKVKETHNHELYTEQSEFQWSEQQEPQDSQESQDDGKWNNYGNPQNSGTVTFEEIMLNARDILDEVQSKKEQDNADKQSEKDDKAQEDKFGLGKLKDAMEERSGEDYTVNEEQSNTEDADDTGLTLEQKIDMYQEYKELGEKISARLKEFERHRPHFENIYSELAWEYFDWHAEKSGKRSTVTCPHCRNLVCIEAPDALFIDAFANSVSITDISFFRLEPSVPGLPVEVPLLRLNRDVSGWTLTGCDWIVPDHQLAVHTIDTGSFTLSNNILIGEQACFMEFSHGTDKSTLPILIEDSSFYGVSSGLAIDSSSAELTDQVCDLIAHDVAVENCLFRYITTGDIITTTSNLDAVPNPLLRRKYGALFISRIIGVSVTDSTVTGDYPSGALTVIHGAGINFSDNTVTNSDTSGGNCINMAGQAITMTGNTMSSTGTVVLYNDKFNEEIGALCPLCHNDDLDGDGAHVVMSGNTLIMSGTDAATGSESPITAVSCTTLSNGQNSLIDARSNFFVGNTVDAVSRQTSGGDGTGQALNLEVYPADDGTGNPVSFSCPTGTVKNSNSSQILSCVDDPEVVDEFARDYSCTTRDIAIAALVIACVGVLVGVIAFIIALVHIFNEERHTTRVFKSQFFAFKNRVSKVPAVQEHFKSRKSFRDSQRGNQDGYKRLRRRK